MDVQRSDQLLIRIGHAKNCGRRDIDDELNELNGYIPCIMFDWNYSQVLPFSSLDTAVLRLDQRTLCHGYSDERKV